MKKLLTQLLEKWACKHEWVTYQKCDIYNEFSGEIPSRLEFILICKKCGKITKIRLYRGYTSLFATIKKYIEKIFSRQA